MAPAAWSIALFALSTSAVVAACANAPPSPYPDVATFCRSKAQEECQLATSLCGVDASTCLGVRTAECNADAVAATSSGARAYQSNGAASCISMTHTAYQQVVIPFADMNAITNACERVFAGNVGKDAPCAVDYDCAQNRICAPVTAGSVQRVCVDTLPKNAGDFCTDPGSTCATGTYCAAGSMGGLQCQPRSQAGQPCGAAPCAETLHCVNGACESRLVSGGKCATNDDCGSEAGYCDPNGGGVCIVGLTIARGSFDCAIFLPRGADAGVSPQDAAGE